MRAMTKNRYFFLILIKCKPNAIPLQADANSSQVNYQAEARRLKKPLFLVS